MRTEVVRRSLFGRCARLDTYRRTIKLLQTFHAETLWNHEGLAIIVRNGHKYVAVACVTSHRPGRIARKHINLA